MLRMQMLSIALFAIIASEGMDKKSVVYADLQIHSDNQIECIQDYAELQKWGMLGKSLLDKSLLAIKVDCYSQTQGEEHNWTNGKLPNQEKFPRYIPLNMIGEFNSDDEIMVKKEDGTMIKLHLRDNFAASVSRRNPEALMDIEEQIEEALNRYERSANNRHKRTES